MRPRAVPSRYGYPCAVLRHARPPAAGPGGACRCSRSLSSRSRSRPSPQLRLAGLAAAALLRRSPPPSGPSARGPSCARSAARADRLILAVRGAASRDRTSCGGGRSSSSHPRRAQGLAREIEQTLRRVDPARLPSASPLRRGVARRHRELLQRLEERLLDGRPVTARGVLLPPASAARARQPALRRARRRPEPRARARARGARAVSTVTRREREPLEPKRLRRVLVGRPMQTGQMHETLLPKWLALPIFASDPLSSVAYATESALVVLVAASASAAHLVFPISIAIACLLGIVVLSYRQTVRVYETSGGAYVVARENLGTTPSLVAAAALLTDYVLTVAVSISAGIYAITSFVPSLTSHKVGLSLACLVVIVLANLRGVRESGMLFALPTYAFVTSILVLVAVGLVPGRHRAPAAGGRPQPAADRDRGDHDLRPAARVLVRLDRAHRRGGDRERRQRLPAPAGKERREDARRARDDRDHDVPRRLVPRGARPRDAELDRLGRLPDRAHRLPARLVRRLHVLRRPGDDAARPRARREHVVPGLPAALGAARAGPLRAAAVLEPRRPARLLERDARARRGRGRAARHLQGEHQQPDPPLRDRRLHRVHALAGRDGALLAARARPPGGADARS